MTTDTLETRFILIGGQTNGNSNLATTHIYDWAAGNSNTWTQLGNLATAVFWHTCAPMTLSDGTNIVLTTQGTVSGTAIQFLAEGTDQWYSGPSLAVGRK